MVVKASLALSHGNAEVERGFSRSGRVLTDDRSALSVRSLNAILNVANGLKMVDNKPHLIPITKELIEAARVAYKSYQTYLEEEKLKSEKAEKEKKAAKEAQALEAEKLQALEKSKMEMSNLESKLKAARGSEDLQTEAVDELIQEANIKLKKAISRNDLATVQVAQAMLEGAVKSSVKRKEKRKSVAGLERKLDKKRHMITSFFTKAT